MYKYKILQSKLAELGVDAYICFDADDHGSEYVSRHFKARDYFSGFTGSNGTLVVTKTEAKLWTDGRYFIQASEELLPGIELMKEGEKGVKTVFEYLKSIKEQPKVAFSFRLASVAFVKTLQKCGVEAVSDESLADALWKDRPAREITPAWLLTNEEAGETQEEKIGRLRAAMAKEDAPYALVASLDDAAWLLNMRGNDIAYNPVNYVYVLVGKEFVNLYADEEKIAVLRPELEARGITVKSYDEVYSDAERIDGVTLIDESKTNYALYEKLKYKKAAAVFPTTAMKAEKNSTEIENIKKAHVIDGVAMVKFMRYLKENAGKEKMTEISVADKLYEFRKQSEDFIELSFGTIAGYEEHGAIVHYEATEKTDAPVYAKGLLLVDSGAQYRFGTTDVTRTFVLGEISAEAKTDFTLVLKGHIDLAMAIFPVGTTGLSLDMLARKPLYERGKNYRHGTGHGVGYLLNVHEGPQNISMGGVRKSNIYPFRPGMVTSDEPGFYEEGKYGIRHENLLLCVKKNETEYGEFLGFEPLTLVPFDKEGIDFDLLDDKEKEYLRNYHRRVYETLAPYLDKEDEEFLRKITSEDK